MAEVRLQKVLAAAGVASRREAERMIAAGRVSVDGEVVTRLGTKVDPDRVAIKVDGKALPGAQKRIYLMMNKPRKVLVTASDDRGRKTVMDLLGEVAGARGDRRVFHVGRLDYHSEGLLLLTNDGDLAKTLTHPSTQVPRTYQARVSGHPSADLLAKLTGGVHLEDGYATALEARVVRHNPKSTWVELVVSEGRNRLVRRMFTAIQHPVQRLVRVEFGALALGGLLPGEVRELSREEIGILRQWGEA